MLVVVILLYGLVCELIAEVNLCMYVWLAKLELELSMCVLIVACVYMLIGPIMLKRF